MSWELPISEAELASLTRELDEAHRETVPAMQASAEGLAEELREESARPRVAPFARRAFLFGAGATGLGVALAACGSSSDKQAVVGAASAGTSSASAGTYTGDLKVVALATALENQAVGAYQAALSAASAGKLGTVPPAVATFIKTAMGQHQDHAKAWNSVLKSAGKPEITGTPLSDQATVNAALGKVTDVGGVAKLALQLENQATQTYLFAAGNVTSAGGIATAATIAPVEAMHASILHFVLGQYPVPDTFIGTSKAASPSQLTV